MKLRRLQEIDLANAAPATEARKRAILKSVIEGFGPWSYDPARAATFSVFNPSNPLGLAVAKAPIEKIVSQVRSSCIKRQQADSCAEVVELLDEWASKNVQRSVERHIPSVSLGSLGIVNYSERLVALCNDRPTFLFLDHRRPGGLSSDGRQFAVSMMHRQIRQVYPEFSNADLRILQFVQRGKAARKIVETSVDQLDLLSMSDMDTMIAETFGVWQQLHEEFFGLRFKSA